MITNAVAKKIRKEFPILSRTIRGKPLIYVDNAATTQKPNSVIDAISNYYRTTNANIHRGVYELSRQATAEYEAAHEVVARFIHARPDEIIFTKNATESINLLAYEITPGSKKNIVLSEMEHHANLVPWQQFAKRTGLAIEFIRMTKDIVLDIVDAKKKITNETLLVSVTHVSNATGTINDVAAIAKLAKSKGALMIVDAAQSIARLPIDVVELGCDFLAFSGHKMFGPTGIGVLYGRKELLEKMSPFLYGGDMIRNVTYTGASWNDVPMKFEAGTPPIAEAVGLTRAIQFLERVGVKNIAVWEEELIAYARERLQDIPGIQFYSPVRPHAVGILSFTIAGTHPHDIASLLDDYGICIRGGHHCAMPLMDKLGISGTARISVSVYNTKEDIDVIADALAKVCALFKVAHG